MVDHVQHQHSPGGHIEDAYGKSNSTAEFDDRLLVNCGKRVGECGGDGAEKSDCGSKPECDQHEEEDDGEEVACRKACQHLWVADESKSSRALYHILNLLPCLVGQMAEDGEDDGAGEQGGECVCEADDEGVPAGGVAELVEGGVGGEGAKANAEAEEGLGDCGVPHFWLDQFLPFWCEEQSKTFKRISELNAGNHTFQDRFW